ncbi:hypothetical protein [Mesorhizobium sp. WSM2561]|uniref:hypothetical protein n=1 Tax=Mesorhizobium sp. WSM2561 TaxID=1040985 RepID=UPI0004B60A8A
MVPPIAEEAPGSERVTPYDEAHFIIYLLLLDGGADGATEERRCPASSSGSTRQWNPSARVKSCEVLLDGRTG